MAWFGRWTLNNADTLLPVNAVSVIRGSSKTLELTVTDDTDKVVDLTGATLYFSVKTLIEDSHPLFQKRSTNVSEIEITKPRDGVARIYLSPADTQTLDPKEYVFDVWVVLASGKRYPVIEPSVFVVRPGVTILP